MTPFDLLPPQFCNWQLVQKLPGEKPTKVPCGPNGRAIDPTNPAAWMTYQAAAATGLPVAFNLTANDPFVFIDLDGHRDPLTGEWSIEAQQVVAGCAGALMEISQSGTGLHIIGVCDQAAMERKRRKWGGDKECYVAGRFVALTGIGLQGDPRTDLTAFVSAWVPDKPDPALTGIPETGPVPEWSGPTDDLTLIGQAMAARGSVAVLFGQHASFRDLWTGNAEALSRFYPTSTAGQAYDASAADAALVMHLGFWSGKDAARVERLWRMSGLAQGRAKLDRNDYVHSTIMTGLQKVRQVYAKPVTEKGVPAGEGVPALPGVAPVPASDAPGYLTIYDQDRLFAGCVYIDEDLAILCPDGAMRDRPRFDVYRGGYEFQMQPDGGRPTKSAWEAFTMNRCKHFPKVLRRAYRPGLEYGAICDDGEAVNVFRPPQVTVTHGDVTPFLDLLRRVMPIERDRAIFLSWCATIVQNPGVKLQWACVLQGCEGNGKTFLLMCLAHAVGMSASHFPNPEDLNEKYNTYIEGNLLIGVEEIHMEGRRDMLDRLKKYITNARVEVRGMRADKRMTDNLTNWLFLTNYQDAVVKSKNDRRYAIFFLAQQAAVDLVRDGLSGDYFPHLWSWARNGGYAAVAGYLRAYQVAAEFDPLGAAHRAPDTSSTGAAIAASMGVIEQLVTEAVEMELPGFRGGWISSYRLGEILEKNRKSCGPNAMKKILEGMGYVRWGRSTSIVMQENGQRPALFFRSGMEKTEFFDYLKAQGYVPP